jgi:hypothetical protein
MPAKRATDCRWMRLIAVMAMVSIWHRFTV